jgi:uncharacterized protein YjbI with pentapeptide repeats
MKKRLLIIAVCTSATILAISILPKLAMFQRRARALELVESTGRVTRYDYDASPDGPDWLRESFGDDRSHSVVAIESRVTEDLSAYMNALAHFPRLARADITVDTSIEDEIGDLPGQLSDVRLVLRGRLDSRSALQSLRDRKCITALHLVDQPVVDADLKCIATLDHLKTLSLIRTSITDAGMSELSVLSNLEILSLDGTAAVTDHGLKHIAELKSLKVLQLNNTAITRAGLQHLSALDNLHTLELGGCKSLRKLIVPPNLTTLNLSSTQLREDDFEQLASLRKLESLFLSNSQFTDAGLRHLRSLRSLTYLDVSYCSIPESALQSISKIQNLTDLNLIHTNISDADIDILMAIPKLRMVLLYDSAVTELGAKRIRTVRPEIQIQFRRTDRTSLPVARTSK